MNPFKATTIRTGSPMTQPTPEQLYQLRKEGHTFTDIARVSGMTENMVKNRIYRTARSKVSTMKSVVSNLSPKQRQRAAQLHYFGYRSFEIAADIKANAEEVRIYVSGLPVHPSKPQE